MNANDGGPHSLPETLKVPTTPHFSETISSVEKEYQDRIAAAESKAISSVISIRCSKHYAVADQNHNAHGKAECGACIAEERDSRLSIKFQLGQKILVREIQRPGRVDMIQIDSVGTQYRVAYWDNGDRKTTWLYEDEIEARN